MRTLNDSLLAFTLSAVVVLPAFAQSGANRTALGAPRPNANVTIVESRDVRGCRVHCGSLAATPNGKTLPAAMQMRAEMCQRKMLRDR